MAHIDWDVAEVIGYERTYSYVTTPHEDSNISELFAIRVQTCSELYNQKIYIARPGNISIKKIPLVGEMVLIYKTFNEQSTNKKWRESWYYLSTIDIQSSINDNLMPGISNENIEDGNEQLSKTFTPQRISPIQPYEGDVLIEGRSGNSIRFGSSIDIAPNGYYYKNPTWFSGGNISDPIIILSNGRKNLPGKEFVVEDIETDASSLYLTSNQQLNSLKLSNPLTVNNSFVGSQFIGIGDRIILRAKSDLAVIDSEKEIILNTPGDVKIGDDSASEPLVHGLILEKIIKKLISAISSGGTAKGAVVTTNATAILSEIYDLLPELSSEKYKIKKT